MRRLVFLVLIIAASPGVALAAVSASGGSGPAPSSSSEGTTPTSSALPYRDRSDEELTALAADWDSLDRHQRRALLTEMKLRMARKGESGGVLHIRTERRYGRLIRQPDGRVIRIETQVVHVRPVEAGDLEARQSFGVGFEHRVGSRERDTAGVERQDGRSAPAGDGSAANGEMSSDDADRPSLNSVLDSLAPTTRAPAVKRLPIYQVSDPES